MTDEEFDAYLSQIIAAGTGDPRERVIGLLREFQEKSYLSGRRMLIDRLRAELDRSE